MTTEDFNHGDLVLIEMTDYIDNGVNKPTKVIKELEYRIVVNSRGKKTIKDPKHGTSILKNFRKDESVKGSFGMFMYKSSWLNYGYRVLGGVDVIRESKLKSLGVG
jgi:hypothetical protein